MSNRTLIILRHAHRSKKAGADADNGLSKKGEIQAKGIRKHFAFRYGKKLPQIFSSPKKRCLETVQPLAKPRGIKIQVSPLLDEGPQLEQRSLEFLKQWRESDEPLTVICSHGDLLPVLIQKLIGIPIDLTKGGWAEVKEDLGRFRLAWLFENFDFYTESEEEEE